MPVKTAAWHLVARIQGGKALRHSHGHSHPTSMDNGRRIAWEGEEEKRQIRVDISLFPTLSDSPFQRVVCDLLGLLVYGFIGKGSKWFVSTAVLIILHLSVDAPNGGK
jgi:hypothetical protein